MTKALFIGLSLTVAAAALAAEFENPHALYSHSKSFTSTAIGILADEGKVDLDERVATVFPDKITSCPSDNLRRLGHVHDNA